MASGYQCPYCSKTCKSRGGLFQHINRTSTCRDAQIKEVSADPSKTRPHDEQDPDGNEGGGTRRSKRLKSRGEAVFENIQMMMEIAAGIVGKRGTEGEEDDTEEGENDAFPLGNDGYLEEDDADNDEDDEEEDENGPNGNENMETVSKVNTQMLEKFREYCRTHDHRFLPLSQEDIASIKLMDILRRKKAPLNAYSELLEWHLKQGGELRDHESLKDTSQYHHRNTLMKKLIPRYNLEAMMPKIKKV